MAELLELSLTYFYLADELNDTSHLGKREGGEVDSILGGINGVNGML